MSNKHVVLVTGTSSGLGEATADLLLKQNFYVIGIDRLPTKIQHAAYTHLEMDAICQEHKCLMYIVQENMIKRFQEDPVIH